MKNIRLNDLTYAWRCRSVEYNVTFGTPDFVPTFLLFIKYAIYLQNFPFFVIHLFFEFDKNLQ